MKFKWPKFKWQDQQYIQLFVLFMVLGFMGWFYMQSTFDMNILPRKLIARLPDIIIEDLTLTQFDEKGQPAHYFHTPHLIHYPHKDKSRFTSPQIVLTQDGDNPNPWQINADRGEAEAGINKIILIDHVIFHQQALNKDKEKNIKTNRITYYSKKNWAVTPEKIFFDQPGLSVQSIGMGADLKEQKIYLLHQVSSIYDPKNSNETL
jgi:LPS export ABC transporter protein LptC